MHGEHIARGGPIHEVNTEYGYMPGFGNSFSTEAEAGALPIGRNSPQKPPYGLYAEVLSGTAFTVPRAHNQRSWLYRILPSVKHASGFVEVDAGHLRTAPSRPKVPPPGQLRWHPIDVGADEALDFVSGLRTMATCGDAATHTGMASHVCRQPVDDRQLLHGR